MDSNVRISNTLFKMICGGKIDTRENATLYSCDSRSIRRDMTTIHRIIKTTDHLKFHHDTKSDIYYLTHNDFLPFEEILAIMKVLIGSRAFGKTELNKISGSLAEFVSSEHQEEINNMMTSLKTGGYLPVNQDNDLIDRVKKFQDIIQNKKAISFNYRDSNPAGHSHKTRIGLPLSLYFSGNYFYVIMYRLNSEKMENFDDGITYVYRLDRFQSITVKRKSFEVPREKFEDEESIRNKSYRLNSGSAISYEFNYRGYYPAALDQLPNSKIKRTESGKIFKNPDGSVVISGNMFFNGAKMWVLSQGNLVTVKSPQTLIAAVKKELQETLDGY
ncbi:helix-turn-helix transcriptional regulator [Companilactobacillus huachuanensis]|uniref:Helix-turn-helix transcriptional regulator n=1 Tax=Companilactobacillus huachuanensis TaxID=2559914 RepID=A0ABW1RGS0_9LACO|nr:WYL domain-containing protein [Companilactobacillus huachuanensis]